MKEDKKELIEDFSNYFENVYNFPPLTSKIYSYLLLDCKREGISFEEFTEVFHVSKSSVSNSLNVLTQLKYVENFTKIDERKRYYRLSPGNMLIRLQKIHDMLQLERKLTERLKCYKQEHFGKPDDLTIKKSTIYLDHLDNAISQLSQTIVKLKSVSQNQ